MPKLKPSIAILVFLALCVACVVFYSNALHNPFIWDDDALIIKNTLIRSWMNLPAAFTSDLYSQVGFGTNFFRPMQTISYLWDYHIWKLDPYGYHLTNIILQAMVAFLVFLFSLHILKNIRVAFSAALIFALCPLHTEAVTYVSGRAEMLMGFFLLSSFLLFIRGFHLFSWLAFIFGLLSKELAAVFPLVIIGYLFYYRRQGLKKGDWLLKSAAPFIAIGFLYLAARACLLNFTPAHPPALSKYPLLLRITVLPEVIFTYIKLLVMPVNLHMSWTVIRPVNFAGFFLNWFLLGMICVFCFRVLKNKQTAKAASFLLLWAIVFFLPQSGILPINAFLAEHFIYLPAISFFILVSYLLDKYLRKRLFIFAVSGLALFYGTLAFSRNFDWQDPVIFYEKIIRFSPDSFQAHNNLGLQYEYRRIYDKAAAEYKKALEIEPGLIEARSNLANVYFKSGRFKESREEYSKVESLAPPAKAGELQNNIGCVYEVEGLPEEALGRYKLALRLDPGLNFAHFNIARIYVFQGKPDLAVQEVLASLPEIGALAREEKRYSQAIAFFAQSPKEFQSAVVFYNNLGIEFARRSLLEGGIASFRRAIELDPLYADAHFNLGLACWKKGLRREAVFEFKAALKINPNHLRAKGFLAEIINKK